MYNKKTAYKQWWCWNNNIIGVDLELLKEQIISKGYALIKREEQFTTKKVSTSEKQLRLIDQGDDYTIKNSLIRATQESEEKNIKTK